MRLLRTLTVITWIVALASPAAQSTDDLFEPYEVVTGPTKGQTVLTGFLLGGAVADIAVVTVDDNDNRRLRIYAFDDGTWVPELDATLGAEVLFVDVANIAGRDRLITYEPMRPRLPLVVPSGRLNWFDPEPATERPLVKVTSDFDPPPGGGVPHIDVTRDVNGDDRDDLVVPDVDGFWVFVQTSDGGFADPVTIGPAVGRGRTYGAGGYRHDPWIDGGVHEMDYNRDGRIDLVFWDRGRFEVHLQDEQGLFAPEATTFTIDVALDGGRNRCSRRPEYGFDAIEVCFESDHSALTTGDRKEKVPHAFADVNGDGVADLVVFSLEGKSVFSVRSTYEVYFGTPAADGGTRFASDVGTAIRSEGMPGWLEQHDFDGDGQVDLTVTALNVGFFKAIGSVLSRSTALDLQFYRMEGGSYPEQANLTRKVKIDLSAGEKGKKDPAYASVLIGDVTGDGRADLLVGKGRQTLLVFVGVPGPELFAREPQKLAVAIPNDEKYTWLVDLNRDGRQDVLIHHPSATDPHRVTTLFAR